MLGNFVRASFVNSKAVCSFSMRTFSTEGLKKRSDFKECHDYIDWV
jgi:hypothetical protein